MGFNSAFKGLISSATVRLMGSVYWVTRFAFYFYLRFIIAFFVTVNFWQVRVEMRPDTVPRLQCPLLYQPIVNIIGMDRHDFSKTF